MSRVHGEAAAVRRLGPGDRPSFLMGEGGSEDACVGGDEHAGAGAAGLGAFLLRMGPWNRKERPSRSGSDSEVRSSYYPRRKAGSSVCCWGKDFLKGEGGRGTKAEGELRFLPNHEKGNVQQVASAEELGCGDEKSNLSYKADITHMTPPAAAPHIFPIGSQRHTALTPTTHRNKHTLQERRRRRGRKTLDHHLCLYGWGVGGAPPWRGWRDRRLLNHCLW